jgi:hypothetical protein
MTEKAKSVFKIIWIGVKIAALPLGLFIGWLIGRGIDNSNSTPVDNSIDNLRRTAGTVRDGLQSVEDSQLSAASTTKRIDSLIAEGKSILQRIRERG